MREHSLDMQEFVRGEWEGAIENLGATGKFKRALRVFGDSDQRELMESLEDAPAQIWSHWRDFYPFWAAQEVERILAELLSLDAFIKKAAWEAAQDHRRANTRLRLQKLQSEIEVHVRKCGGMIDYAPAFVARQLSKTRQTLKPARVDKAMRVMVRRGLAKSVVVGKGSPDRFVLLN